MGLLGAVVEPLRDQLSGRSAGVIIGASVISFVVLTIVLNVLNQLFFRNHKEPPVVFHWVPFFGSTIVYGIDPYDFFFKCQRQVQEKKPLLQYSRYKLTRTVVWQCFHLYLVREEDHGLLGRNGE